MNKKQECRTHIWVPSGYIRRNGLLNERIQQFQCRICKKKKHSEY